jgi:hypothetical protein
MGSGCIDPRILDLGTSWRLNGQLHASFALPLGKKVPGTHWVGGRVGQRTGLGDMERTKNLPLPGLQLYTDCAMPVLHILTYFFNF